MPSHPVPRTKRRQRNSGQDWLRRVRRVPPRLPAARGPEYPALSLIILLRQLKGLGPAGALLRIPDRTREHETDLAPGLSVIRCDGGPATIFEFQLHYPRLHGDVESGALIVEVQGASALHALTGFYGAAVAARQRSDKLDLQAIVRLNRLAVVVDATLTLEVFERLVADLSSPAPAATCHEDF